jgi:3-(3-hydroxy-phenyl)propionate hydroxylase
MATTYEHKHYAFVAPADLGASRPAHHPILIVGAGPIGLATALDLGRRGYRTVILDDSDTVSIGSRAICWAKRSLEILDRLGCGERLYQKGVTWNTGKVFFRDDPNPVWSFNLQEDRNQHYPAFINLQQYYAEEYLVDAVHAQGMCDLRWKSEVIAVESRSDHVRVTVRTPAGDYALTCDWLIAADGSRSPIRTMLNLRCEGETFQDHFLIADVRMKVDFPPVRMFWFDPPFNPGYSALLHKQPDDVWRIDFQLGWNIDRDRELQPQNITRRIHAMLGADLQFDYEWTSIYTFRCQRMDRFVHGRVLFVGDSAHLVSPFGARGANSGLQDVDNLVWKLDLVLRGLAPASLLESYDSERVYAADENIRNSARATDFMTPKSEVSRMFRDVTLELARDHDFARRLVNAGRLSVPATLRDSTLNTPDTDAFAARVELGAPSLDAPVTVDGRATWFLREVGEQFVGLYFAAGDEAAPAPAAGLGHAAIAIRTRTVRSADARPQAGDIVDAQGFLARHYDARPGTYALLRPDQHLTARWRSVDATRIERARDRACARA